MDLFGRKRFDKYLETVKQMQDARLSAFMSKFNTTLFPHYKSLREQMVFQTMDDVYSIVSRLALTAGMIPYYAETADGEQLPPTDKTNYVVNQLTFEMKEKIHMNLLISGEVFLYKERLDAGVNAGLYKLICLNPVNVVVNVEETFPFNIINYTYQDINGGVAFPIAFEDMVYVKLENPGASLSDIRGLSPIKVLANRLTRVQANLDVSVSQLQNGGLPGVLFDKSPMFTPDLANQHKENFGRFLNNSSNKSAPYIMGGDVGYVPIGSTLADLDLASLADIDFDKICNAYGVSSTWFNNKSAATESNVKEMIKLVYTNAVLPNVMRIQDAINNQVMPELNPNARICYDISDIPELQDDFNAKANTFAAMPVIIPNEVREGMGYERIDDPLFDQPLIKQGYQLLSDLVVPPDVPMTGDYNPPA
jgi:hypothetical protein